MKKMLLIASALFTLTCASQQVIYHPSVNQGYLQGFVECLPVNYDPAKTYPVLITSHGQGELGDGSAGQLPKVMNNAPARLFRDSDPRVLPYGFIVLSFQSGGSGDWNGYYANAMIDYALSHYHVLGGKVALQGLSLGGCSTMAVLGKVAMNTKLWCVVSMCGAVTLTTAQGQIGKASGVPVWFFHNQQDPTVNISKTTTNYALLVGSTGEIRKTIFPASGHDCWSKASDPNYRENGMNIYEWMLSKMNVMPPAPVPPVITVNPKSIGMAESIDYVRIMASANERVTWVWNSPVPYCLVNDSTIFVYGLKRGTTLVRAIGTNAANLSGSDTAEVTLYGSVIPFTATYKGSVNLTDSTFIQPTSITGSTGLSLKAQINPQMTSIKSPGDNGTNYPMGRYKAFNNVPMTLVLSELNPDATYDVTIYGASGTNAGNVVTYTSGGQSYSLSTFQNKTQNVTFKGLKGSRIEITAKGTAYAYINSFTITENVQ